MSFIELHQNNVEYLTPTKYLEKLGQDSFTGNIDSVEIVPPKIGDKVIGGRIKVILKSSNIYEFKK